MFWTAEQYAANAPGGGIPLRTAQWRLRHWFKTRKIRVLREEIPATGDAPPRARYLLDVASWRAITGIVDDAA